MSVLMSTSTDAAQPDAGTDVGTMSLDAVRAELAGYTPATAFGVVRTEEHMTRRARLWRRLDELNGIRRPAAAAPTHRGAS